MDSMTTFDIEFGKATTHFRPDLCDHHLAEDRSCDKPAVACDWEYSYCEKHLRENWESVRRFYHAAAEVLYESPEEYLREAKPHLREWRVRQLSRAEILGRPCRCPACRQADLAEKKHGPDRDGRDEHREV